MLSRGCLKACYREVSTRAVSERTSESVAWNCFAMPEGSTSMLFSDLSALLKKKCFADLPTSVLNLRHDGLTQVRLLGNYICKFLHAQMRNIAHAELLLIGNSLSFPRTLR